MKNKVVLESIVSKKGLYDNDGEVISVFIVGSDNEENTVTNKLILSNYGNGWIATMPMEDFPAQKTITASAWKLAEWMERMGKAIKEQTFDQVNLNGL